MKLVRHWAEPGFVSQSGNLEHHIIPADYFQARVGRLLDGQDAFGPASSWFIVATDPSSERGYHWYTVLLEDVSGEARKTRSRRRSELDGLSRDDLLVQIKAFKVINKADVVLIPCNDW